MIYGYIRVSSDKQTVENQRFEINKFCKNERLNVDDWIEETISGTKNFSKRQLGLLWINIGNAHVHSSLTPLHSTESYRQWGLRAEGKDIWWKCGGGILGETEGGKARFGGLGGGMGTGGKAVSEGWRGRWACIGLRGLRDRGAKGKGWSLERAGIVGRKMAFRGGEWCVWKVAREGLDSKWLVVRRLQ